MASSRVIKTCLIVACLIIMVVSTFAAEEHDDHAPGPDGDDHDHDSASMSLAPVPALIVAAIATVFSLARN